MTNDDADGSEDRASDREVPETARVSLSLDATFDMLAHSERRIILQMLVSSSDHTATIDELVTRLVQHEADKTGEMPNPDGIETQIHHVHLPKMENVGLIEYDARSEEIRYWPDDRLERWLQRAQTDETD